MTRRPKWAYWLLVVAAALALRSPALTHRFYSNDEATYSALAARIMHGGTMYVDAIDHKPPGIAYLYAAVYRICGTYNVRAVRVLVAGLVALTGIALGALAASMTGATLAGAAGLLYVFLTATGFAPNTQAANTELVLNLPLAAAALAMLACLREPRAGRAWWWAVCAGAATGAAALFKYQAALAGVAWLGALVLAPRRSPVAAGVTGLAAGFGGVAAALVAVFALTGHLDAFLFWGWRYNFQYIASVPASHQALRAVTEALPVAAGWAPALVLAGRGRRQTALAWLWLAAMTAAVCLGGRFFGNYFLMTAAPLAVLAGAGLAALDASAARGARWFTAAAALAAVSALAAPFWDRLDPATERTDRAYHAAGDWIRLHSTAGDRLFVWGDSAQIYVYAGRLMGTRFAFTNYHTGTIWGTASLPGEPDPTDPSLAVPRAWTELVADLTADPPAFIADAAAGGLHNFAGQALDRQPRLWAIIQRDYEYAATAGGIRIYRRRA